MNCDLVQLLLLRVGFWRWILQLKAGEVKLTTHEFWGDDSHRHAVMFLLLMPLLKWSRSSWTVSLELWEISSYEGNVVKWLRKEQSEQSAM